jgi:iron(III) transport system permease protein
VHHAVFDIFTMKGMILSDGICGAAVPYIILLGPLNAMDPALEEASRSSGGRHLRTIFRVTLPVLRPALISGFALTSVMVASEFETPVLIGRPGNVLTYMSELYASVGSASAPNYDLASARAMVYLVFTSLLLIWYVRSTRVESRFTLVTGRGHSTARMNVGRYRYLLAGFVIFYFILAAGQLIVTTVLTSLVPFYTSSDGNPFKKLDLDNYHRALGTGSTIKAIENSLYLSLVVAIVCVLVASALSFVALKTTWRGRRIVEVIATLPIGLPPVVFSAALLITVLSVPGFVQLYGTIVPLVVADVVVTLPFAIRVITGALISIQGSLLEASAASGAGMFRTMRKILVPLLLPAATNAGVLVYVRSFLQLGAVVFLITPSFNLLPTTIFSLWGTGNYGMVSALNVVSVVLPMLVFLLALAIRRGVRAGTSRITREPVPTTV